MFMLTFAYGIRDYQIADAPGWASSDRFDVSFTPDKAEPALRPSAALNEMESNMSREKQRTQAVLRDRLGLILRAETHQLALYALILAKGGHKLSQPTVTNHGASLPGGGTQLIADGPGATIKMLADYLADELGRPVTNETGLDGLYTFKLQWTRDSPAQPPSPDEPVSATAPRPSSPLSRSNSDCGSNRGEALCPRTLSRRSKSPAKTEAPSCPLA